MLLVQMPDIRPGRIPNIRKGQILNSIFCPLPDILQNIRPDTGHPVKYPAVYRYSAGSRPNTIYPYRADTEYFIRPDIEYHIRPDISILECIGYPETNYTGFAQVLLYRYKNKNSILSYCYVSYIHGSRSG